MLVSRKIMKEVHAMLKNGELDPIGEFDESGNWLSAYQDLMPTGVTGKTMMYNQLKYCRTYSYVYGVATKFFCINKKQLLDKI